MKVSKDETLTQAFVLEKDDLETLNSELQNYLKFVNYKIECKDRMTREFENFSDFIEFENTPKTEILSLIISGYNLEPETIFHLRFDKTPYRNIYTLIKSNEENAIKLSDCFERIISSIEPWYAPLTKMVMPLIFWTVFTIPCIIYLVAHSNGSIPALWSLPSFYIFLVILFSIPIIVLGTWLSRKFDNLYFSIFPKGIFAINQGLKRHKDRETVRTVIVLGFIISFVSSLVVSLIFLLLA